MNEMNHLERQLRSWMPRPPSGKLKTRLFTGEARHLKAENPWQFSWRHFAPVTGHPIPGNGDRRAAGT